LAISLSADTDEAERELAAIKSDKRFRLLEDMQASCGVIYSQARIVRTSRSIRDIFTENDSQAFVGMLKYAVYRVEQLIGGVRRTDESLVVVVVSKG
jgi:uncharacterized membrane protein YcjF (UPF0283 family)